MINDYLFIQSCINEDEDDGLKDQKCYYAIKYRKENSQPRKPF